MGNIGSSGDNGRRRTHPPPPPRRPETTANNRYVFAPATPYPQYPHSDPYLPPQSAPPHYYPPNYLNSSLPQHPSAEHSKAPTFRNLVSLKKDTLRIEADGDGKTAVAFTFDAAVAGSITVVFFAKEGEDCTLTATKGNLFPPTTVRFQQGLRQNFRQPTGTGVDVEALEEHLLKKIEEDEDDDGDIYPLAIKAEACPEDGDAPASSEITQALLRKDDDRGEYRVEVVKQILWANRLRYELQDIYGIGNSKREESFEHGAKECVLCLYQPRDVVVLPCRHMCMCNECAKVLRFRTDRCPICNQPMERLVEIKLNGNDIDE